MAEKKEKIDKNRIKKIIITVIPLCLVVWLVLVFVFTPSLWQQLVWALKAKPEPITELYFEDHLDLPSTAGTSEEKSFRFTIHNLENTDMAYTYEIYIDSDGGRKIIGKNTVFIEDKEYRTISESFKLEDPVDRARVIVRLAGRDQEIGFWITVE